MSRFYLLALLASLLVSLTTADVPADLITTLPGYGKTPSKQYSGLIAADPDNTVFLHYWFVTSTGNPSTDPVAVWMNGGPGCSSLEGFLTELGPFTFTGERDSGGIPMMTDNPHAWTTVSSVLFLEQPAGVGFSYAVNGSTRSDDYIQSQNTYNFLLNWFKAYPEYAKNEFFITGESYAGIYVPTLAQRILDGNAAGQPHINLKGIAVGNGCTGHSVGMCGNGAERVRISVDLFHGHGMISNTAYENISRLCGDYMDMSPECERTAETAIRGVGRIDVYNVYDVCGNDNLHYEPSTVARSPMLRAPVDIVGDPVVCVPTVLSDDYLSNEVVRKAIHVDGVNRTEWTSCSSLGYNRSIPSLLGDVYPRLIANMDVLIYSGDADACVPWNGSYNWTRHVAMDEQIRETVPWRPWMVSAAGREWTGGFVTQWGANFTYITIKHAGHMVPAFEPEAAITFYSAFLKHRLPQ